MKRYCNLLCWFLFLSFVSYSQDSLSVKKPEYKLGFFDLFVGSDTRFNRIYPVTNVDSSNKADVKYTLSKSPKDSYYQAGYVRMQQSFLSMIFSKPDAKFWFGDIMVAELSSGYTKSNVPNIETGYLFRYNFEFGLGMIYRPSQHVDILISTAMLKFGRELFSFYYGGSNYFIRTRVYRTILDLGMVSENKLYFGAFNYITEGQNLSKLSVGLRYFVKPNYQVGVRVEALPVFGEYVSNYGKESTTTFKLFYGLHF